MNADQMITSAIARRMSNGLSVEVTGIEGRTEPHIYHCRSAEERDAYIERCKARGETARIMAA